MKWLSAIFIILALAYLIMPIDYDGPVIGFVDDFFVFMAAFCFAFAQFSRKANQIIRRPIVYFLNFIHGSCHTCDHTPYPTRHCCK